MLVNDNRNARLSIAQKQLKWRIQVLKADRLSPSESQLRPKNVANRPDAGNSSGNNGIINQFARAIGHR